MSACYGYEVQIWETILRSYVFSGHLDESYAIWIHNRIEADEQYSGVSSYVLEKRGVMGITLLERLLYELMYFGQTGAHLDRHSKTLCAGTHDLIRGNVPTVWSVPESRAIKIGQCGPGYYSDKIATRAVMSM